ncbi:hypothetical protein IMG5_055300 [Ichthyophthirius multifiliis]|uniref:Transmembrane protein n=1 Tax=Ichthyophthirius multifiliis TaxID=5932 RepID=G0QN49_ICHMU|nr:hypothetical protein IMG5_055300 [Ichthyophthirius multifiliis]EGR33351.1 hypothetical protein IMG5_055300 [Ichthyophthirius multifiliis]|eukprot:XP_004037337.1 hypothetical protein IMG5_055300 [Ichthyophthirius multifiliis]
MNIYKYNYYYLQKGQIYKIYLKCLVVKNYQELLQFFQYKKLNYSWFNNLFYFNYKNEYKTLFEYIHQSLQQYIMYIISVLGGLFISQSLFGLSGVYFRSKCCIFLSRIFSFLISILFIALGITLIYLNKNQYQQFKDANCEQNQNNDFEWLYNSNEAYKQAQIKLFCQDLCQCYIKNPQIYENDLNFSQTDSSLPYQVQQCQLYNQIIPEQYRYYDKLANFIETYFKCSGICDNIPYYIFSDINNSPPQYNQGCKKRIQDFLDKISTFVYLSSLILGGIYFLLIMLMFYIKQVEQKKEKYNKLID